MHPLRSARLTRLVPTLALTLAAVGLTTVTALPAQAGVGLASEVVLHSRTVHLGAAATKDASSYPSIVRIDGVTHAAAVAIGREVTRAGRALVRPKGGPAHTSVDVSAVVTEADRRYVSVVLMATAFTDGAAHPDTSPTVLVFARPSGRHLSFSDLFPAVRKPLPTIASELRRNAARSLGPAYDRSTVDSALAKPAAGIISDVVPRAWGAEFFFAQGDIAASAAGPVSIVVPWKGLLRFLAVPQPDLGGGAPSPSYGGGQAVVDSSTLKVMVASVVQAGKDGVPGITGRTPGSYRLIDARRVLAQIAPDVIDELDVITLMPFAAPSRAVTVLLGHSGDQSSSLLDVIDAQRGPAGCGVVSSAFIKALGEHCP